MPVNPHDNLIELSDFSGGWQPDLERAAVDDKGLLDVRNLLPDIGSATPQSRPGFERILYGNDIAEFQGYNIQSLHAYNRNTGDSELTDGRYLIAVGTNGVQESNDNIRIWAINITDLQEDGTGATVERISPEDWYTRFADAHHYGLTVEDVFYGGGRGIPMYSWDPDAGFEEDVALGDYPNYIWNWDDSDVPLGGQNQVQRITIDSGSGHYKLRWRKNRKAKWETSGQLTYEQGGGGDTSTEVQVEKALNQISALKGRTSVEKVDINIYEITFTGRLAKKKNPLLRAVQVTSDLDIDITQEVRGFDNIASDYAFEKRDIVRYNDYYYGDQAFMVSPKSAKNDATGPLRVKRKWEKKKTYKKGDRISVEGTWDNSASPADTATYWRTFEARKTHDGDEGYKPGTVDSRNEIQRLVVRADSGSYRLHMDGFGTSDRVEIDTEDTTPDATLATALSAIDDFPDVVPDAEYTGDEIHISYSETEPAQNDIQRITVNASQGYYRLEIDKKGPQATDRTDRIRFDASATDIATHLTDISGFTAADISVTDQTGALGDNTVQKIRIRTGAPTDYWRLWARVPREDRDMLDGEPLYDRVPVAVLHNGLGVGDEAIRLEANLGYNDDDNSEGPLEDALAEVFGVTAGTDIDVQRTSSTPGGDYRYTYVVTFQGALAGTSIPLMEVDIPSGLNTVDNLSIVRTSDPADEGASHVYDVEFIGKWSNREVPKIEAHTKHLDGTVHIHRRQEAQMAQNTFIIEWPEDDYRNYPLFEVKDENLHGTATVHKKQNGRRGWQSYWNPLALSAPRQEPSPAALSSYDNTHPNYASYLEAEDWIWAGDGGEIEDDWDIIAEAATTNIACWWGERMWLRDDNNSKSRVQYSAPLKHDPNSDIGELMFDPLKAFGLGDDDQGNGGGFFPVLSPEGDDIQCLLPYGQYLLIFKERSTWVLSGQNEDTWTLRRLGDVGAAGPRSAVVVDGLAYFISSQGVFVTDGTQLQEVPGGERVRDWLRESMSNELLALVYDTEWEVPAEVVAWGWNSQVWFALPSETRDTTSLSLVYDIATESFWKQDLAPSCVASNRVNGVDELFFSGTIQPVDNTNDEITDDDSYGDETVEGIPFLRYKGHTIINCFKDAGFEIRGRPPYSQQRPKHWPDRQKVNNARRHMEWKETFPNRVRFLLGTNFRAPNFTHLGHMVGATLTNQRHAQDNKNHDEDGESQNTSPNGGRRWEGLFQTFHLLPTWAVYATADGWSIKWDGHTIGPFGTHAKPGKIEEAFDAYSIKVAVNATKHTDGRRGYRITFYDDDFNTDFVDRWTVATNCTYARHVNWRMRAWVRHPNWKKGKKISYKDFRFFIGDDTLNSITTLSAEPGKDGFDELDFKHTVHRLTCDSNDAGTLTYADGVATISAADTRRLIQEAIEEVYPGVSVTHYAADTYTIQYPYEAGAVALPTVAAGGTGLAIASVHVGGQPYQKLSTTDEDWDSQTVTGVLPRANHTYKYRGNGWWRVTAEWEMLYTDPTDNDVVNDKTYGCLLPPGLTLHVDRFKCRPKNTNEDLDDDEEEVDPPPDDEPAEGNYGLVYWYNHPNRKLLYPSTDDLPLADVQYQAIPWMMRTAWISFGVLREERRVRRSWALVRGGVPVTTTGYINYHELPVFWNTATPRAEWETVHYEPRVPPDAHSVSLEVSSVASPAGVLGVAWDTEPRRRRYGVNPMWHQEDHVVSELDPNNMNNTDALDLFWP